MNDKVAGSEEDMVAEVNGQATVEELKEAAASGVIGGGEAMRESIYMWEHGSEVEPWPEAVDGKVLLDELETTLRRFAVLPKWAAETLALWVVHTYAFALRDVSTYIGLESPQKRCGKTTVLTVMCELVNRPVVASNISSPAFFRVIEEKQPTLMIDEADTLLRGNDTLRGILNAGYARKTGYVVRVAWEAAGEELEVSNGRSDGSEVEAQGGGVWRGGPGKAGMRGNGGKARLARYSCWCPKMIATIQHLPETLRDRCIVIGMQRKTVRERCARIKQLRGVELRRKCARFVKDHAEEIREARSEAPVELNDRAADIWEPLLVLADLAGGEWPERARQAALGLTGGAQEESPIATLLLDIFVVLAVAAHREEAGKGGTSENGKAECEGNEKGRGEGRAFTRELVAELNRNRDRPWWELTKGKPVTEMWLARQLRVYGVRPRTIWIGGESAKGYVMGELREAFQRYVPRETFQAWQDEARAAMNKEKDV